MAPRTDLPKRNSLLQILLGAIVGAAAILYYDSRPMLVVAALIALGGAAKLLAKRASASRRMLRVLNAVPMLLIGAYVAWYGLRAGAFSLLFGGVALAGMGVALLLPNHSRLVGAAIGTVAFGTLAVRYALLGDWIIVAAFLLLVVLFGRMGIEEWGVREPDAE